MYEIEQPAFKCWYCALWSWK